MDKFLININGQLFNEETAKISVLDRGFLYGDSVYEATRTFNRLPFRIDLHLERLFLSAQKINLSPTYTKEEIKSLVNQTITASSFENIFIRIILTRGTNSDLGLDTELATDNNLIIITKAIAPNPEWWLTKGLALVFYQKQSMDKGPLPKTGNYQDNTLAYKYALSKGANDALMINPEGHITESTTSNFWVIKNNIILTPPLSDGVLPGLTRKTLIDILNSENLQFKETSLNQIDALEADECFISSTTRNLVPVTKIEDQKIGDGTPGKMTLALLQTYLKFIANESN